MTPFLPVEEDFDRNGSAAAVHFLQKQRDEEISHLPAKNQPISSQQTCRKILSKICQFL